MRLRKMMCWMLVHVLIVASILPASVSARQLTDEAAVKFVDMPNDWSTEALQFAIDQGLMNGTSTKELKISPKGIMTRAQLAAIMNRAFGAIHKADLAGVTDVPKTAWYAEEIAKAKYMKTLVGVNATGSQMSPERAITHEEAYAVLARAFKLPAASDAQIAEYKDHARVSPWAVEYVKALAGNGYLADLPITEDKELRPKEPISRAEFAHVLYQLTGELISSEGTYSDDITGNLLVRTSNVTLKGMTISGNLVLGDGVGEGNVTLNDVTVGGDVIVRGGGVNSIIITGNSKVGNVIIAKVGGNIRIQVTDHASVSSVYVDDGQENIILQGDIDYIEVNTSNLTVVVHNAKVDKLVVKGSNVIIKANAATRIGQLRSSELAKNTVLLMEGKDGKNIPSGTELAVGSSSTTVTTVPNVPAEPSTLSLDQSSLQLLAGEEHQLVATTNPSSLASGIVWTSSNPAIATVDASGKVKAASIEALKSLTKSQRITTITATVNGITKSCTVNVGPVKVYFYQTGDVELNQVKEGVQAIWSNYSADAKELVFSQPQYVDGMTKVTFDIATTKNINTTVKIRYINRFYKPGSGVNIFEYALPVNVLTGSHQVTIDLSQFQGTYDGQYNGSNPDYAGARQRAYEITRFEVALSGSTAELDTQITNFKVHTNTAYQPQMFDVSKFNEVFPETSEIFSVQNEYDGQTRVPKIFIADHSQDAWNRIDEYIEMGKEWPGQFGVDFSVAMFGANRESVDKLNAAGIKSMFEINKSFPYYTHYVESTDDALVRIGDDRNSPYFFPAHGEDTTQPAVFKALTSIVDEAKRQGFKEFLLVDYVWPWDGRWGYGDATVQSFREDLNRTDEGMWIGDGAGGFKHVFFWDYLNIYSDYPITPSDVANFNALSYTNPASLTSWDEYVPVSEPQASIGHDKIKRNLYLFNALWHYEHLKFYQKLGDYADSIGMNLFASFNTEDTMNGTDTYMMGMLRNIEKVGYEYFGNPGQNTTFYHTMRYYTDNMNKYGHDMSLIAEINETGHGPAKHSWEVAYAYYYDSTTVSKPIDYNNQYMEGSWHKVSVYDPKYTWDRYANWYSGAEGFLQSHRESSELQPIKSTVLVSSRSVLEYQAGSINSYDQAGNIANVLDQLHIPFDSAGKEGFDDYAKDAKVIVYSPAESSPKHEQALEDWLSVGADKALVTHSFVPFSKATGIIDLTPMDKDLTWDGFGNWGTSLNSHRIDPSGIVGLTLQSLTPTQKTISYTVNGSVLTADLDIYGLVGSQVLVKADDGITPLISRVVRGSNEIVYINADISNRKQLTPAKEAMYRAIAAKAMEFADVKPEVDADAGLAVHLYEVPGGTSAVIWDKATFVDQGVNSYETIDDGRKFHHFYRDAISHGEVHIPVGSKNTQYTLYDFFADVETQVNSGAEGVVNYKAMTSTELFYMGRSDDAAFAQTLANAKATRAKLDKFTVNIPEADKLDDAIADSPDSRYFLEIDGGMTYSDLMATDGTSVIFEGRDTSSDEWYTIGRKNFKRIAFNSNENWGLPLGQRLPEEIRVTVSRNSHSSFDSTILTTLKIIDTQNHNGTVYDYLTGTLTEVGVYKYGEFTNDAEVFSDSGAVMKLSNRLDFHPPYGKAEGQSVYGVLKSVQEAKSFNEIVAQNPSSEYFLSFKGGMDASSVPNTDGVTLIFEVRNEGASDWTILGKKNFADLYFNSYEGITADTTQWALALGSNAPEEIRVTAFMNGHPSHDMTYLTKLDVVTATDKKVVDFLSGTLLEKGLLDGGVYTSVQGEYTDAFLALDQGRLALHPAYGPNIGRSIYGLLAGVKKTIPQALPFDDAIIDSSESSYFLMFSGGIDASQLGSSDGTTMSVEGRANSSSEWTLLGEVNFEGKTWESEDLWALPLGSAIPQQVRVTVFKNGSTSGDSTHITVLAAVDKNKNEQLDYLSFDIIESGLTLQVGDTTPVVIANSGAVIQKAGDGSLFIHPPYVSNTDKLVYGILAPPPGAQLIADAKSVHDASEYFLTFEGGMDPAYLAQTDGTMVTFEGRKDGNSPWTILGEIDFNGRPLDDGNTWALPLGATVPQDIRIKVFMNGDTPYDGTYLTALAIITKNDLPVHNFLAGLLFEKGFYNNDGSYDSVAGAFEDAAMSLNGGRLDMHPPYASNKGKSVYGIITAVN
ncbi:S-layer homology domain-containing protein [Paenibacillus luteus]|uniref:S-layer homology domain-containing protein n=1 Tax=Paenibacillus luteus TaxID=2545753 RepID=UPI00114446F3|nr:S-layer homology domain-containing protein [Paenibacillus luteus]